ncbi:hypothetical protein F9K88_07360 [Brucella intermedia]|uniref:hypothetical protein n=1 Tax=Brucella intermedia TaxID=94625 RepID=UPI00124D2970|nr:hypothetical protein [Brucella intermedia]KAB2712769.1 hypothetical protein F9K88_07360 [Brucella intermedia]
MNYKFIQFGPEGYPLYYYDEITYPPILDEEGKPVAVNSDIPAAAKPVTEQQWADAQNARLWLSPAGKITLPPEPAPIDAPHVLPNLTARQLRLGLRSLGKLAAVDTAINQLPEPAKSEARIEWDYASEFRRDHPLILQLIPILGLDNEQVDALWMEYSAI